MSNFTKVLLMGGAMAWSYVVGKSIGIADCVVSTDKVLNNEHKLNITKAVWHPFKKGVEITMSKLKEES